MRNYEKLSIECYGEVKSKDFWGYGNDGHGLHMADRIAKDINFDEQCRKACENRDRKYAMRKVGIK